MPRLSGLIFDLDGTLVDSAPDLRQALNATLAGFGRPSLILSQVKHLVGDGAIPLLTRAFEATGGVPPDFDSYACVKIFLNHYRDLKPDTAQIYPQVRETLAYFHDKDIKLGICTNKQEEATVQLLKELDLVRYFTFIAGGDTFLTHKPHPGHITGVMKELGVNAQSCAMVGDGTNDVAAAHGAGIPCIVVTHGYGENFAALGADRLIGSFDELLAIFGGLGFDFV